MVDKLSPEDFLARQIEDARLLPPTREYRFYKQRRWRFDFAWPDILIAVECEGGGTSGRHRRWHGYEKDCEKYNQAAVLGWTVLRFTTQMIKRGEAIDALVAVLPTSARRRSRRARASPQRPAAETDPAQ